ncbi:uncharacterized protein LOC141622166 [Silene latifolia]|uniref:uncharacterized protein LOC141622166 n=1 Tax=Silene latifolia TaxID=37657 RepID=UPI003D76B464
MNPNPDSTLLTHTGGCHCRAITFQVTAPKSITAWKCNCSNCSMRGNTHFIVPTKNFLLLTGQSNITTYTFGTHTAKHTFCNICGITSFYTPRSNPDGVAVTLACVDPGSIDHVEIVCADGRNWEEFYSQSGISACSK